MNYFFEDRNHIARDYIKTAQDYDKSFKEFEDHVSRSMVRTAREQKKIQLDNNRINQRVLEKFRKLGL